jgi:hypothetical protein
LKQAGDEICLFVSEWLIYVDDVVALDHRKYRDRWKAFKQRLFQQYEFNDMGRNQVYLSTYGSSGTEAGGSCGFVKTPISTVLQTALLNLTAHVIAHLYLRVT